MFPNSSLFLPFFVEYMCVRGVSSYVWELKHAQVGVYVFTRLWRPETNCGCPPRSPSSLFSLLNSDPVPQLVYLASFPWDPMSASPVWDYRCLHECRGWEHSSSHVYSKGFTHGTRSAALSSSHPEPIRIKSQPSLFYGSQCRNLGWGIYILLR